MPEHQLVQHEAMKTTFTLRLCGGDRERLLGLAGQCIERIDELERKLSRYYVGGDVFRINHLRAGETLNISEECHDGLLVAMEAGVLTDGLFDPTLGRVIDHLKNREGGEAPVVSGQLVVHPDRPAVTCAAPGRIIDLGGIGKGFTLDRLAEELADWEIEGTLLSAGASTHLAMGAHVWPIELAGDHGVRTVDLENGALSASGSGVQGAHIVHPGGEDQTERPQRVWVQSDSAAFADAWSTALMLMPAGQALTIVGKARRLDAVLIDQPGGIQGVP